MENILLTAILVVVVMSAMLNFTGYVKKNTIIKNMTAKIDADSLIIADCFSEDVIQLYFDVMQNREKYFLGKCTFEKEGDTITVWASNDIYNRKFYTHDESKKEQVEQMNSKLTYFDKVLLDNIIKAIGDRNKKILTKVFL